MLELITTRHNPMVDPSLHVWGWEIPVYLFLGGWVAGSMIIAGWLARGGRRPGDGCVCHVLPWLSLLLLSLVIVVAITTTDYGDIAGIGIDDGIT